MIALTPVAPIHMNDLGFEFDLAAAEDLTKLTTGTVYLSTHNFAFTMRKSMKIVDLDGLRGEVKFPPPLTREFIENPPDKKIVRLLAINGVGSGIGDCIGGLTALRRLSAEFEKRGRRLHITLLPQDGKWKWAHELYFYEPSVVSIRPSCITLQDFLEYDVYSDTEDYVNEMDKSGKHMYYFMCDKFCVPDYGPIVPSLGIESLAYTRVRDAFDEIPRPIALVTFFASSIRAIPPRYWKKIVNHYAEEYHVVTAAHGPNQEPLSKLERKLDHKIRHKYHNMSDLLGESTHHLVAAANVADFIFCPDTGLAHIAGITGTPAVVVFYSIDPKLRVADFPNVTPYCPDVFRNGPHWGMHKPVPHKEVGKNEEEIYLDLCKKYQDPRKVKSWSTTWSRVDLKDMLAQKPGPRQPSRVYTCPTRRTSCQTTPTSPITPDTDPSPCSSTPKTIPATTSEPASRS